MLHTLFFKTGGYLPFFTTYLKSFMLGTKWWKWEYSCSSQLCNETEYVFLFHSFSCSFFPLSSSLTWFVHYSTYDWKSHVSSSANHCCYTWGYQAFGQVQLSLTPVEMCFCFIPAGTGPHWDDELVLLRLLTPSLKKLIQSSDAAGSCCFPASDGCFCRISPSSSGSWWWLCRVLLKW